ncbi:GntR family transcriptional regulator [Agaricicola taiwanensis]|uniref:GntR family transcriptional regulator n=1 Tax=Agaricicola taiwanensis TaxID=591372 RepID=A0A8J2VHM6_9RHOB|nr:PLP-dependent aminotransferase family protein [Agaricicola taiwanensis]GGE30743.1 GntR family transcriptional regulator [Agaricicola taiwanensis]
MSWYPKLPFGEGPRYLQIVAALQADIAAGNVSAGDRLPTHREMADKLGLSVGTVSKAYAAAERRGLISGKVGKGTFLLPTNQPLGVTEASAHESPRRINLALNTPPPTGEDELISRTMTEVMEDKQFPRLLGYLPHQGREEHRRAVADWLGQASLEISPNNLFITHGAQHAISIAMRLLSKPGTPVLAENLTYSGMMALALMEGYALKGVLMDHHGIIPDRLDEAFKESGAKTLYLTPTFQTASASIMPVERRREIAEIVRRHDAWVIEDDAYGFLSSDPLPTVTSFIPDRAFYVVSFAKCLAPGLRIGAMVAPPPFRDRIVNSIRATGWMANAVMSEAVVRMMKNGSLAEQVKMKRAAAAERVDLARELLGDFIPVIPTVPAFHLWVTMSLGRTAISLFAEAAQAGLTLASPTPLQPLDPMANGFRLCLGGASNLVELRDALTLLRSILDDFEAMAMV